MTPTPQSLREKAREIGLRYFARMQPQSGDLKHLHISEMLELVAKAAYKAGLLMAADISNNIRRDGDKQYDSGCRDYATLILEAAQQIEDLE